MQSYWLYANANSYCARLDEIHKQIIAKMKRTTSQAKALELQTILQEIKNIAYDLSSTDTSVVAQAMQSEYYDLVQTAFSLQKPLHGKTLTAHTLFRRGHKSVKSKIADNIFEEDLAAIIAAGEFLGGNTNINLSNFIVGGQTSGTRASDKAFDFLGKEQTLNLLKKMANKEQTRAQSQIKNTAGKIDITGERVTLSYNKVLPNNIERLMVLMKNATFTAKSYTSKNWHTGNIKQWSEIGLHLGNSNLIKAIPGALMETKIGHNQAIQLFAQGVDIYTGRGYTKQQKDIIAEHFTHLRFIYELRGSGLLDSANKKSFAEFLIYNDPASKTILVKDTASIIVEALQNTRKHYNLLGLMTLSVDKILY